jgi:hypothetical protein
MIQHITFIKRYIIFLSVSMILSLTAARSQAQQCNWNLTAVADSSTCDANGTVVATLTSGGSSVTGVLYRIVSLTGPYESPQIESNQFHNVPAGTYKVVASGACNGREDSISTTIIVPGNYVPFEARATMFRRTLNNCNTGQIRVTLLNGRRPYHITIESKPATYNGPTSLATNSSDFVIDNLTAGTYVMNVYDECNLAFPVTVAVTSLGPLNIGNFFLGTARTVTGNCNQFTVGATSWTGTDNDDYNGPESPISYSIAYNGGAPLPYQPAGTGSNTVTLPAGQTLKDMYGKQLTYYVRSVCGEESQRNLTIATPTLSITNVTNCDINFRLTAGLTGNLLCGPFHFTIVNSSAGITKDTVSNEPSWSIAGLPYGTYAITVTTADGFSQQSTAWTVQPPLLAAYSITTGAFEGPAGNHRAASFNIYKTPGNFLAGTRITLLEPEDYSLDITTGATSSPYLVLSQSTGANFYPNSYKFQISDGCTTTDIPVVVTEDDVYNYSWDIPPGVQTCAGLKITPTGTAMYQGVSRQVYFRITGGPSGYNGAAVPLGGSLYLPSSGQYTIAIGSNAQPRDYGGINKKTVNYEYNSVRVDINRSKGWVCPNLPADSGYIRVVGMGGSTDATGVYIYKLALPGNGANGPYLDSNTVGEFSTSAAKGAYKLTKGNDYDVRIIDECGVSAVQSFKIVDLATEEIATADQAEYCLGDTIRFRVINLPSTAITYQWTGPDGFTDTRRNPEVSPVTEKSGGQYHVTISADICHQPINADVNVVLASYITSCYSAVTDTSVNPYAYGLLGNWRPSRAYTYYGARESSDPNQQTNIQKDGAFNDFMAFWQKQTDGWKAQTTDPNWVWNTQTTLFNKKGFELENKDPLGRYNAGIYGYDNAVPVAVVQNSRYSESAFEGFEDYGFVSSNCDDGKCPVDRRFSLSGATTRIVGTAYHTGRYSLMVTNADKDSIAIMMPVTDTASAQSDPVFNMKDGICPPNDPELKSVRANRNVLLPPLSLLSGKKVVLSAWVREAQDCKCTSYTNSQIKMVVKAAGGGESAIVLARPAGGIIDGWQRIEQVVDLPAGTEALSLILLATGNVDVYFDDIRVHPYNANMKSFVYDAQNLRLMAELDENNYATFYEYDDDATLTRMKKETERGIKTIRETRSAMIKEVVAEDPNIDNY